MSNVEKPYVILAAIDYSDGDDLVLTQAIEMATLQERAEVHVVNVVSFIPRALWVGYRPDPGPPGIPIEQARADLERHVAARVIALRDKQGAVAKAPPPRLVAHVRVGPPPEEIAQLCADLEADLLVLGTRGRRGVSRVLLGSVAEGAVRLAPCPVLVARSKRIVEAATIEPPCAECVKARNATKRQRMWCERHAELHGQRNTPFPPDCVATEGTLPLVFRT